MSHFRAFRSCFRETRTIGMTQLAAQSGVTREALYKALSPTGDPRLSTFLGVIKALGIKLTPHAA
jgi:probable addiction module antidote protein